MFGRFGVVFILIAVLLCTGILSAGGSFAPNLNAASIAGLAIMIASGLIAAASGRIASLTKGGDPDKTRALVKLGALVLAGIGAIVVFCG